MRSRSRSKHKLTGQDGSAWFADPGKTVCVSSRSFAGVGIYVGVPNPYEVGDAIIFTPENGATLPPGIVEGETYYVVAVNDPIPGVIQISATPGGTPIIFSIPLAPYENAIALCVTQLPGDFNESDVDNGVDSLCTDAPGYDSPAFDPGTAEFDDADVEPRYLFNVPGGLPGSGSGHIKIQETSFVCQVIEFSVEITRERLNITTFDCKAAAGSKYALFQKTQAGYAKGSGTMTVYLTEDQVSAANRLVNSVALRSQNGGAIKLYVSTVSERNGPVDDNASLFIESGISVLSMSLTANPDDAISAELSFTLNSPQNILGTDLTA